MNYKLIIYGNNMYKEVVLDDSLSNGLTIGTEKNCQIGFRKERFLTEFVIRVDKQDEERFIISCNDSVYLKTNTGMKEYVRYLTVGEHISICYDYTDTEFLYIDFLVQFDTIGNDYDKYIDCRECNEFTIGGNVSDVIRIDSANLINQNVRIRKVLDGYEIDASNARYGVEINGFASREQIGFVRHGEFFSIAGYSFCLKDGFVYTSKKTEVITNLKVDTIVYQKNHFEYPEFKKNVRQRYKLPEDEIEILDPKTKEEPEEQSFLLTLLPMIINMLLMVGLRGIMGGGGMFVIYFAATMTVTTTITIITHFSDKKKRKEKEIKRHDVYMEYLSKQEDEIIKLREREHVIANQMHPRLEEYVNFVAEFDNRLFEKAKDHDDYLAVRMGDGIVPSNCQVTYKKEEYVETEDTLKEYPKAIHDKYEYLNDMPILLELNDRNAVGFIGSRTKLYQMAKNLIIQYAASHYYKDVKLYMIMDEDDVPMFEWARWFQIFYNEHSGTRNFMYDEDSIKFSLEFLYSELSMRESLGGKIEGLVDYIVFVYRSDFVNNHPVSKFISKAKEYGFRFIFFEEYEEVLNPSCEKRIFLEQNSYNGYVQDVEDGKLLQQFSYGHISKAQAEMAAKKMSCVYVDEINLENNLTKNISLFELLKIMTPYDLDLNKRWSSSQIYKSMAAPLGVKSGDEIVYLDLHEKAHGPHGLVAGTTGSGKSEILQSYILSMATLFHPHEVGFIIIDFKGGGMVNQFRNLPHLNGAITNIDGNEIERSLLSIKAELMKRQEVFAEHNVNHVNDYIKLYKAGKAKLPLPHLILIVDEFAELKSEQPEFMKELISAARIGRSLGVHLILATQKPSGVVSEQIWSNSKFKLCLKVQNKNDSNEVLKSPLAAEIREPGRAYLQVGNNEIFQLFQSAYSGASAKTGDLSTQKKYQICKVELSGKKTVIFEQKPDETQSGESQLDAIVNYVNEYCQMAGIEKVPEMCLPSLSEAIPFTLDGYDYNGTDIVVPIGIVDDPAKQRQYVNMLNLSQSNIYMLGSSQSGKTNTLQAIIRGITSIYSPEEVNIYILDFASMIMKNFSELNHVGGVILSSEEDKLKTFLKMLQGMVQVRKSILARMGLSSYSAYRETGKKDMPQIVVMLDNWVAFRGYFPEYEETIIGISRECVSLGICLIVTAAQASGAGFKLLANFSTRTALYCNDSGDYSTLFEGCRKKIPNIPGRAIVENSKTYYECQYYLAFAAEKEFEKIALIKEYIDEVKAKYGNVCVKGIPEIPERLTESFLYRQYGESAFAPYEIPLGMEFNSISKRTIKLDKVGYMAFLGPADSGKNAYVQYLIKTALAKKNVAPIELYIADNEDKTMSQFESSSSIYTCTIDGIGEILNTVVEKVAQGAPELQIIAINSGSLLKTMSADKTLTVAYKKLVAECKGKVCFLYTDLANDAINFTSGEVLKSVKEKKQVVAFDNLKNIKAIEVSAMLARDFKKPLEGVDAYLFVGDGIEKIRTLSD